MIGAPTQDSNAAEQALAIVQDHLAEYGHRDAVETALGSGANLAIIAQAMLELAADRQVAFDAIGARGFYGEALAQVMAVDGGRRWFTVRSELKGRGTNSWVEGTHDLEGKDVIIVDAIARPDTVLVAQMAGKITGANVRAIMPAVAFNNGVRDHAAVLLSDDVQYLPLITQHMLETTQIR